LVLTTKGAKQQLSAISQGIIVTHFSLLQL